MDMEKDGNQLFFLTGAAERILLLQFPLAGTKIPTYTISVPREESLASVAVSFCNIAAGRLILAISVKPTRPTRLFLLL